MNQATLSKSWTLSQRLKFARVGAGLDQAELGARVGAARASISNYERGLADPPASVFVRWAGATGVTLDWLAEGVAANDETPAESISTRVSDLCAPRDLNPEPADYGSALGGGFAFINLPSIPNSAAELLATWAELVP